MHKKPTGFARSRGRPPNGNPNLFVDCTPRSYEHGILQVHLALVCHERLFAVKLRWGDKPRIRDDTAALRLLLARVETLWPKPRSDGSVFPFGSFLCHDEACFFSFHRNYCLNWAYMLLPSKEVSVALYSARDWIEITCARGLSWELARDNQTTASFDGRSIPAARWGGRSAPARNEWPKLFAGLMVLERSISPFAARDWIRITCTGEFSWELVRDNDTTTSFAGRIMPAARWGNRDAPTGEEWPKLFAGLMVLERSISPFAARDWIRITCTGEFSWKLARDNDTTASLEGRIMPAFRWYGRDALTDEECLRRLARSGVLNGNWLPKGGVTE